MKKIFNKETLMVSIFIIIQTIIFIICGANKSYIHMDEAYSLGLASYHTVGIQDNEDFYDTWHNKEYYEDYLAVNDDEVGQYSQVYENQKNDVHPPLYYLILRFAMGFSLNHFSMWPGIIINIIIYAFITIFSYLIIKRLIKNQEHVKEKAIIVAFMASVVMASLTNVIYIRMYALSALNILITTFLHMKLLESENINYKLLVAIGASALVGSLTHYYYLFYLAMMYLVFAIKYIKHKKFKNLISYTLTMAIAGVLSILIFPYSIQHMFFGYRGQGVISNLLNVPMFLSNIGSYILKIDRFVFNNLLLVIAIIMLVAILCSQKKEKGEKNEFIKIMVISTAFYFFLVSVASPWTELRYVAPVCSIIFITVMYALQKLLKKILDDKKVNILMIILFIAILIAPFVFKIEPEVLYSDKKEIVEQLKGELNVPTVFFFNSQNNRFLDDILLFSEIDESYIAKDLEYTEENIQNILKDKDLSNGLVVFINEGWQNDDLLNVVQKATNLTNVQHLKRLNACDVYVLKSE